MSSKLEKYQNKLLKNVKNKFYLQKFLYYGGSFIILEENKYIKHNIQSSDIQPLDFVYRLDENNNLIGDYGSYRKYNSSETMFNHIRLPRLNELIELEQNIKEIPKGLYSVKMIGLHPTYVNIILESVGGEYETHIKSLLDKKENVFYYSLIPE